MLTTLRTFFSRLLHSKYALLLLTVFACYSFAADANNDADVIDAIVQIMNLFFVMLTILMTPAIIMAGWLLSPDWTMGDFFGLRPYFVQVWVLVSNLTYIIFALMLLWMAVMQIFTSKSPYAFKNKIGRFLVGILIVPFTWLIVSWTLSFANQAVAAVLSIPMGAISTMQADSKQSLFHNRVIPTKFKIAFGEEASGAGAESVSCNGNGETPDGTKCISPAEFVTYNQSGPFFIILIYAYDIFKVQNTNLVSLGSACGGENGGSVNAQNCIRKLAGLASKLGVSLITTAFFIFLLIALCWVLLARAFKLWIYVMFSPLFGLAYAVNDEGLGESLESGGGGGGEGGVKLGKLSFMSFFKLAMVPVLVAAVLSFGLLFIGVIQSSLTGGVLSDTGGGTFCTGDSFMVKYCISQDASQKGGYTSKLIIGSDETNAAAGGGAGKYTITFEFGSMISDFVGNSAATGTAISAGQGALEGSRDIFAQIILSIIALIVMWMGIKAAVKCDEITDMAFAPFAKFGDSVGNFVQHIPSYLPTPHPAFAALTPGGMDGLTAGVIKFTEEKDAEVASRGKTLGEMLSNPELGNAMHEFRGGLKSANEVARTFGSNLTEAGTRLEGSKEILSKIITDSKLSETVKENLVGEIKHANGQKLKTIVENLSDEERKAITVDGKNDKFLQSISTSSSTASNVKSRFTQSGNTLTYKDGSQPVTLSPDAIPAKDKMPSDMINALQRGFSGLKKIEKDEDVANARTQLENSTGRNFSNWDKDQLEKLRDRVK